MDFDINLDSEEVDILTIAYNATGSKTRLNTWMSTEHKEKKVMPITWGALEAVLEVIATQLQCSVTASEVGHRAMDEQQNRLQSLMDVIDQQIAYIASDETARQEALKRLVTVLRDVESHRSSLRLYNRTLEGFRSTIVDSQILAHYRALGREGSGILEIRDYEPNTARSGHSQETNLASGQMSTASSELNDHYLANMNDANVIRQQQRLLQQIRVMQD
eukprot:Clim_evm33s231 gene=Clim_evmTU33s231